MHNHDISHDITIATQIARGMAAFYITNVSRQHGGLYSCYYYSNLFRSNHSEQVKLMIIDQMLGKPNISFSSVDQITLGSNFTIRCQSPHEDVEFYFQNANTQVMHQTTANHFIIGRADPRHGGNYQCSYTRHSEPFISSEPSNSLLLLLTDPSLPRPSLSLSSVVVSVGETVSLQCQAKTGPTQPASPSLQSRTTIKALPVVTALRRIFFVISEPSTPVEFLVIDRRLHTPTISIVTSQLIAPGAQVNITCTTNGGPANFYLHKAGDPVPKQLMKAHNHVGIFSIGNISREDEGNYSCSYACLDRLLLVSQPSNFLELLISGPHTPNLGISEPPDYTLINIIRFAIGSLILFLLTYVIIRDQQLQRKHGLKVR
ncbi:LOW QUALITY PROTEIN: leukocyte immunoglobulin-like receptor subfamily A member 2 [Lacerta agilis]|uniref:LOW QUALITY PROTEIN: leukocyte immunoglobulin-like receptor subfamily A member 2 n=1 Tax=Lacerta agilis TaxID=80427 RepID=UPI0014198604|nr:LOW QUALITY PROTEIN: leukocyte immunoglobulin-like receptor subfamily A member 2 [Lacerta agilis]